MAGDLIKPGDPGFVPPTPGPPDYYGEFLQSIRAIEHHTRAVTTLIPAQTAALSKKIADVYKDAGQPSRPTSAPQYEGGRSGYSTLDDIDSSTLRAALGARSRGNTMVEDRLLGTTRSLGSSWQDRANMSTSDGNLAWLHIPGARMTPVDYLDMLSVSAANLAQKSVDKRQRESYADAKTQGWITTDADGNDVVPDWLQEQLRKQSAEDPDKLGGRLAAKGSDFFAQAQRGYITGQKIKGMVHDVMQPIHNARDLGYATGYSGGSGTGPLGIRSPFDAATMRGFGQRVSSLGFAFNNDITPGQSNIIYDNLFRNGWMGGGPTNAMRATAASMMRHNPMIASMPQYYDMMDKATRQGSASLQNFNAIMKQIPDAASAAHVSIGQTVTDMDAMGAMNKTMGGTYVGGMLNSTAWQNITGLPAGVMQQLMQNPLVQGQTFMRTGLMPWEQGLATPGQHIQAMMGSVDMLNRMILTPGNKSSQIGGTGFYNTTTGQDQKEALISHFLGVDKQTAHTMLTNRTGYQAGANIYDESVSYSNTVQDKLRRGDRAGALQVLNGTGKGTWGQIRGDLKSAVDSQGHKVFEDWDYYKDLRNGGMFGIGGKGKTEAHKLAQQRALDNIQHAGDKDILNSLPDGFEFGKSNSQRVKDALKKGLVSDKVMAKVGKDRAAEIQKYQKDNTAKFGASGDTDTGPKLQIELGPAAKKHFNISDPNSQQKSNRNAGSASVDLNSYLGPSAAPQPDLSTASGGTNSYDYGGQ